MSNYIAVTIGDIKGIGIKIFFEALKNNHIKNTILFTNIKIIEEYIKRNNLKTKINIVNFNNKKINFSLNKLNIYTYKSKSLEENTYNSLKYAYDSCIKKFCIGIITLPLRKDIIKKKLDKNFIGHTEFFQKIDKKKYSNMILYHKKIIVSTLTTHLELKNIPKIIKKDNFLLNQILNLNHTLIKDFNIKRPKLIISGLNPHAGENGSLGREEVEIINPVINKIKKKGILIDGPLSADSILINKNINKYDCFIFIYHDQALIPFKFISQFTGVNYTGNLSIIRTSPDHGTAYKLIKSKKFSNKSFINCYKLIKKIFKNRLINGFS